MQANDYAVYKTVGLAAGLIGFAVLALMPTPETMTPQAQYVAAVAVWMATWWITEAVPLPATALLPLALFPLLGILPARTVAQAYGDPNIFLFAGGFFIAMAMQKWGLHERIALNIISRTGANPRRLVLGFMLTTGFLSMWISNTATTMMMLPIGLAVISEVAAPETDNEDGNFPVALMLGIAYAASIGGVATLIGTPPNIVLAAQLKNIFPEAPEIGFLQWMLVGMPLFVVFLPLAWLVLTRLLFPTPAEGNKEDLTKILAARLNRLGPMSRGERVVLMVACLAAVGWIFRADIRLQFIMVPGWSNLFPRPELIHDSTVAVFCAAILFAIPVDLKNSEFALDWDWARRIPWGILLLFGGGLALAKGFTETALIHWAGEQLALMSAAPTLLMIAAVALLMTMATELTSNTATATIMLPILAVTAAQVLHINPLLLMVPAAISASCAFMLPVATPPNAIVFGSGHLTVPQMARAGILLNLMGAVLVTALMYFIAMPVFGIVLDQQPLWAQ